MSALAHPARIRRARTWFVALNTVSLALFVIHLVEEQLRGALDTATWWLVGPIVASLAIGTLYSWLRHTWARGMALGADLWIALAVGYFHLVPGSPDYFGSIHAAWGAGPTGVAMAAVAIALWVVAVAALVEGAWALTRVESRPFGRPDPA